ncbi:hypothetical protein ONS95_009059 [Cadophora gregata]|uniref:uncharacterized protein n=1 Tax=Cadophora gregata TaxID=51156 RepID=UPI0026DB22AC|nr:uncharacterized protein ONS95_009059 [Cadophora gregata]KAK0124073.1 hypothetical protein ONS95_009059 [Cadophora gregata]KAK0130407.1 hypothetical protein ONS96_000927 [Cadophora gregata f. sp. sojae]
MADIGNLPVQRFIAEYQAWQAINSPTLPPTPAAIVVGVYNASRHTVYNPGAPVGPPPATGPTQRQSIIPPNNKPALAPAPTPGIFPAWTAPVAPDVYNAANWRGVKQLGQGGFGTVTLWEYIGPQPAPPRDKIAVKLGANPDLWLRDEGWYMEDLAQGNSQHIVKLLVNPVTIVTPAMAAAEGLGPGWPGTVRRLIMEYCPQGSMRKLIDMRRERNIRFEELTLWRIFECLVDGCAVLEHGLEFHTPPNGVAQIPDGSHTYARNDTDPGVLVHFDLKPDNSKFCVISFHKVCGSGVKSI